MTAPEATTSDPAPGESTEPGRYDEFTDNGSFSQVPDGTSGSAMQVNRDYGERLRFYAYIECDDDDCTISVQLENSSGRTVTFPDGALVELTTTHDGSPMSPIVLELPDTTQLAPGASVSGSTSFAHEGPGTYEVTGRTQIELQ